MASSRRGSRFACACIGEPPVACRPSLRLVARRLVCCVQASALPRVVLNVPYTRNVPTLQMPANLTCVGPPLRDPVPPLAPRAEANWIHHLGELVYLNERRVLAAESGANESGYNVSWRALRHVNEMFADIAQFSKQGTCLFRCQQL